MRYSINAVLLAISGLALVDTAASVQFNASECGLQKACLYVPVNCQMSNICRQIFSYFPSSDDWITMEIFDRPANPSSNFVSIGFSKDNLMGEEPVTHCSFQVDPPQVHLSYNNGKSNFPLHESDQVKEEEIVELLQAAKDNGQMYCKFRQKALPSSLESTHTLKGNFTILLTHGVSSNPRSVAVHELDPNSEDFPTVFAEKVEVSQLRLNESVHSTEQIFPSPSAKRWFVLVHGILMLIAWFLMVAIAVAAARYLRNHWPNTTPFDMRIWFHIHRTVNAMAVVLMIIACLLVFYAKDWRWTGPAVGRKSDENFTTGAVHSALGAIAVALATLQPVIAFLRCAPDAKSRFVFNWIHRSIGLTAVLLAVIAIFIAAASFRVWSSRTWAITLIIIYVLLVIPVVTLSEMIESKNRRRSPSVSFETDSSGGRLRGASIQAGSGRGEDKHGRNLTTLLLSVFIFLGAITVAALIYVIVSSYI